MMFDIHAGYVVIVAGAVTVMLRVLPFVAFGRSRPDFVLYLGRALPPAVMAMLAVYCLRSDHGVPEAVACCIVVALHVWKRNTLLSITAGTLAYMVMVQGVFV